MPEINPYANPPVDEDDLEPSDEVMKGLADLSKEIRKTGINDHLLKVTDERA